MNVPDVDRPWFEDTEAALKTYAAPISAWASEQRERGDNAEFLDFFDGVLSRSIEAGYGDEELSASSRCGGIVPDVIERT